MLMIYVDDRRADFRSPQKDSGVAEKNRLKYCYYCQVGRNQWRSETTRSQGRLRRTSTLCYTVVYHLYTDLNHLHTVLHRRWAFFTRFSFLHRFSHSLHSRYAASTPSLHRQSQVFDRAGGASGVGAWALPWLPAPRKILERARVMEGGRGRG